MDREEPEQEYQERFFGVGCEVVILHYNDPNGRLHQAVILEARRDEKYKMLYRLRDLATGEETVRDWAQLCAFN